MYKTERFEQFHSLTGRSFAVWRTLSNFAIMPGALVRYFLQLFTLSSQSDCAHLLVSASSVKERNYLQGRRRWGMGM